MTKNKRREAPAGLTSQGVRDLNNLGPRRPRPSDEASAAPEVAHLGRRIRRGGLHKYQLSSLYGMSEGLIVGYAEDDES